MILYIKYLKLIITNEYIFGLNNGCKQIALNNAVTTVSGWHILYILILI